MNYFLNFILRTEDLFDKLKNTVVDWRNLLTISRIESHVQTKQIVSEGALTHETKTFPFELERAGRMGDKVIWRS